MSATSDKLNKRGVKSSYISTIIGISLVLFMIGIVLGGFFGLENIQKQAKESLQGDLFFIPDMNSADIKQVEQELKTWHQFNEVFFVSPERAIEEFTGEDQNADNILAIFDGDNPLPPTIGFKNFILLVASLILIGVVITFVSTWFALNKYLRLKLDDLY